VSDNGVDSAPPKINKHIANCRSCSYDEASFTLDESARRVSPLTTGLRRVLIVEDQASDMRTAADLAMSLGAIEVEARTTASAAQVHLQSALDGEGPLPDLLVVDLDLGYESGFELLRLWHSHPKLSTIPLIVWTGLGEEQQEICRLFKVNAVVNKSEGMPALKQAMERRFRAAS
jgi:CheY-like chemotaxis protein